MLKPGLSALALILLPTAQAGAKPGCCRRSRKPAAVAQAPYLAPPAAATAPAPPVRITRPAFPPLPPAAKAQVAPDDHPGLSPAAIARLLASPATATAGEATPRSARPAPAMAPAAPPPAQAAIPGSPRRPPEPEAPASPPPPLAYHPSGSSWAEFTPSASGSGLGAEADPPSGSLPPGHRQPLTIRVVSTSQPVPEDLAVSPVMVTLPLEFHNPGPHPLAMTVKRHVPEPGKQAVFLVSSSLPPRAHVSELLVPDSFCRYLLQPGERIAVRASVAGVEFQFLFDHPTGRQDLFIRALEPLAATPGESLTAP